MNFQKKRAHADRGMGERREDGMTAIKIAMNNYQSCLQTSTKTGKLVGMSNKAKCETF
jgi:hypothetical protein